VEEELALPGANQQLTYFLEHSSVECANLKETIQGTKVSEQIFELFFVIFKIFEGPTFVNFGIFRRAIQRRGTQIQTGALLHGDQPILRWASKCN
jgi:hypothetical protein